MCGIAGALVPRPLGNQNDLLKSWSDELFHRGPDDAGFLGWSENQGISSLELSPNQVPPSRLLLVQRRLSIIDLTSQGRQPMVSPDGRWVLNFNGEIYNFLELKKELEGLGHRFQTQSDSEVLLHVFMQWGVGGLEKLTGMFAIALTDLSEKNFYLIRDYFGIKPLYYVQNSAGVFFASELKAVLKAPGVSRVANAQNIFDYLRYNRTDQGRETIWRDISQVPAGHLAKFKLESTGAPQFIKYWTPKVRPQEMSLEQASQELREKFLESVGLHLRSDVALGACLSGGIDSTAIVCAMRELDPSAEIHALSFVSDDRESSEESWAILAAEKAKATLHRVVVKRGELLRDLPELIRVQETPFASTSIYAQYRVFQKAKELGLKVMLDGQGADETFGGYFSYISARLASLVKSGQFIQAWSLLRQASQLPGTRWQTLTQESLGLTIPGSLQNPLRFLVGRETVPSWLSEDWIQKNEVQTQSQWAGSHSKNVLMEKLVETLTKMSLPMLLRYEDRNSMAHSIESRVPFLNHHLVDFVLSLPEEFIISAKGQTKHVLRIALEGLVPQEILDRKDKVGFVTPERAWLRDAEPWFNSVLRGPLVKRSGILNSDEVLKLWQKSRAGGGRGDPRVWRVINLMEWASHWDAQLG